MPAPGVARSAYCPGRVNLIGDHTDYNGGLALPMAIGLGVSALYRPEDSPAIVVTSDLDGARAELPLAGRPQDLPSWGRLAAAVVAEVRPARGGAVSVTSDLPAGSGLSSSAAFGVALALALGAPPVPMGIARLCQRAELATGVPVGLMDPLAEMHATEGHCVLIDFGSLRIEDIEVPPDWLVLVVDSGVPRRLEASEYALRREQCEAAAAELGHPLVTSSLEEVGSISDPLLARRARHVVSENARVRGFVDALRAGDAASAGALMDESHASLRDDFEVSIPELDRLVEGLSATPGIHGARLTGAGFGGCVVALSERDVELSIPERWWAMRPSAGAWAREL